MKTKWFALLIATLTGMSVHAGGFALSFGGANKNFAGSGTIGYANGHVFGGASGAGYNRNGNAGGGSFYAGPHYAGGSATFVGQNGTASGSYYKAGNVNGYHGYAPAYPGYRPPVYRPPAYRPGYGYGYGYGNGYRYGNGGNVVAVNLAFGGGYAAPVYAAPVYVAPAYAAPVYVLPPGTPDNICAPAFPPNIPDNICAPAFQRAQ